MASGVRMDCLQHGPAGHHLSQERREEREEEQQSDLKRDTGSESTNIAIKQDRFRHPHGKHAEVVPAAVKSRQAKLVEGNRGKIGG